MLLACAREYAIADDQTRGAVGFENDAMRTVAVIAVDLDVVQHQRPGAREGQKTTGQFAVGGVESETTQDHPVSGGGGDKNEPWPPLP